MFGDDLLRPQFGRALEGHLLVGPRCANHSQRFALRRAQRAFHHVADAVNKAQANMVVAGQCDIHCLRRNKRRFGRHHGAPRPALRQVVLCARPDMRVFNGRNDHFFHQPANKGRFACPHGADNADINIALCSLGDILIKVIRLHNIPPCRHASVCALSGRYYASCDGISSVMVNSSSSPAGIASCSVSFSRPGIR